MKKTKRRTKYLLLLLILFISVGYAILQSNLNITGTTGINNATWDIHWNNVKVTTGSVTGTNVTTPATINTNKTTVNYIITLSKPGDFYEFTVDAVNEGTIDGMIESVSSKLNGTEITTIPNYLNYSVTYSDGAEINANQELKSGTTETYKVRVEYKKDISVSDLPGAEQTLNLSFSVTYKQADGNAQPADHGTTVYTVSSTSSYIGQAIPSDITQYSSASEAMAAYSDNTPYLKHKPLYLKHVIRNGVIDESYVEFVVTPEMAIANSGMTAGTYALRGLDTYDEVNDTCEAEYYNSSTNLCLSPYYESNKETLLQAFGSTNCDEQTETGYKTYSCRVSGLNARARSNGNVYTFGDGSNCRVGDHGDSDCGGAL